jgi:2-keto-4-pentenoate hydratase/2-oxohepta-3-ene-1,7-dioic acid hydratase in catechol pathway
MIVKLVLFDNWSTGVMIDEERLVDVSATVRQVARVEPAEVRALRPFFQPWIPSWEPMIAAWSLIKPAVEALVDRALAGTEASIVVRTIDSVTLLPPLPSARTRIFAMATNFADHSARALSLIRGVPVTEEEILREAAENLPSGFVVLPDTIVGSGASVTPPPGHHMFDYEAEVAVVLSCPGEDEAVAVWGYTAWNDLSVRDKYFPGGPRIDTAPLVWPLQKNFATGNAAGPWMVVGDETDVQNLQMRTYVNGDKRQDASTADMIYSFETIHRHLSAYFSLRTGDMLVSGTPMGVAMESGPEGPYLRPGDVVEVEVGAQGTRLRNVVGRF